MIFLYKFVKGECPMSFGINVARMAGLPKSVLEMAGKKSEQFALQLDRVTGRVAQAVKIKTADK